MLSALCQRDQSGAHWLDHEIQLAIAKRVFVCSRASSSSATYLWCHLAHNPSHHSSIGTFSSFSDSHPRRLECGAFQRHGTYLAICGPLLCCSNDIRKLCALQSAGRHLGGRILARGSFKGTRHTVASSEVTHLLSLLSCRMKGRHQRKVI